MAGVSPAKESRRNVDVLSMFGRKSSPTATNRPVARVRRVERTC